jgi:hypothetical protein
MRIILDPEEYDVLVESLERKPKEPEEMPKMWTLLHKESPFVEEECTQ